MDAGLHPDEVQVLSSTVPVHRIWHTSPIVSSFRDAGLRLDEPSALKYRACALDVPTVTHARPIYGCWPTPR